MPALAYLAFIPGHGQRPQGYDPGAVSGAVREAVVVRDIAARAMMALGRYPLLTGGIHDAHPQYRDRVGQGVAAAKAAGLAKVVVCHLHCNASGTGQGTYTATITDARSPSCGALAEHVEEAMQAAAPRVLTLRPRRSTWQDGFPRAQGLIETVWTAGKALPGGVVHALVVETAFVDTPSHAALLMDGAARARLAVGLVTGLARGLGVA
jgi:N-acetylmuramoyl-L-alanine amidase